MIDGYWYAVRDCDDRARGLFARHYSMGKHGRMPTGHFCGPGERMMLMTLACDALWLWRVERYRRDGQEGVNCAVFRNEGAGLSSELIREADELAFTRWPGQRHFTYIDAAKTARRRSKHAPIGKCFVEAGWAACGTSASGLVLLERLP